MSRAPRTRIFGAVAVVLGAVLLAWEANTFLAVGACLDAGGSFDYQLSVCDHNHNHPARRPGSVAIWGIFSLIAGVVLAFVRRRNHAI